MWDFDLKRAQKFQSLLCLNTRNGSSSMAIDYGYNLHNWVTEINGPGFHEQLYYNDFTGADCSNTKYYNGNISIQKWQASSDIQNRGYKCTGNFG